MTGRPLTPAQETFATGVASGLSQSEAYRRAYPRSHRWKPETVWREASRLAAEPKVSTRVQELLQRAAAANEVTVERVVKEMARLAFFDVRRLVGDDGRPLPLPQLDDDTARAIVGLDVASVGNADIGVGEVLKFKLADKRGALELLARHLGMLKDRVEHSTPPGAPLQLVGMTPAEFAALAASVASKI